MRITNVKLTNWRSCQEVSFATGRITAFVGANNAGKTGILSALDFLMGSNWPSLQRLDDSDFYGRTRKNGLRIQVWFEKQADQALHSAWFEVGSERGGETGGRINFKEDGPTYNLKNEFRDRFPLIFLDAERSYERQFGTSRYTLFGQALRRLEEHFSDQVGEDQKRQLGHLLDAAQKVLRTDMYDTFVTAVSDAFREQLRHTRHGLNIEFRAFDPFQFYKALHPFLTEGEDRLSATEAGSGLRNMLVLALFRAYGKSFRGDGMVAIEEPELFLHPHAQRGLMRMFREIALNGTQILYSTHSSAFVDLERFDDVVVVERCPDEFSEELCTTARSLSKAELLQRHRKNRPGETIGIQGIRERYRHACGAEHTEALFGRVVVLVEGATEAACLPMYADAIGLNLNALGVSVVNARGKDGLESLHHVYAGLGFAVYVVFDNDLGKPSGGTKDIAKRQTSNLRLTRLLGIGETSSPAPSVGRTYAVMDRDFENVIRREVGAEQADLYDRLAAEAKEQYGTDSKPVAARHIAEYLTVLSYVPPTIRAILEEVALLAGHVPAGPGPMLGSTSKAAPAAWETLDDHLPF